MRFSKNAPKEAFLEGINLFLGAVLGVRYLRLLGGQKPMPLKIAPTNRPYIKLLIDSPNPLFEPMTHDENLKVSLIDKYFF